MMEEKLFVVDTSVVVDGRILQLVKNKEIDGTIIVPKAVLYEIEHQANLGLGIGFTGIEVLKELKSLCKVEIEGKEPSSFEIAHAKDIGCIDRLIRECAKQLDAVLITGDVVQHLMAELEGIRSKYLEPKKQVVKAKLLSFFTKDTMSIHLKEGTSPLAKRGKPGEIKLCKISEDIITREQLKELADNIREVVKQSDEAHFEISRKGIDVVQLGEYRVVITRPPFSDGWEITATHPIVHLDIEDYHLKPKLRERFEKKAEGIVICGKPGSGKSTFAAALAKFYSKMGKIVKTLENPRDLVVGKDITQYAPVEGDRESVKDVLLLVRPDYTIFDEVRAGEDFQLYADLRMTGVGMVGVVHANSAIDAVHRFVMKIDLGLLPQIVDTIVFIENGKISKVYNLSLVVKVPRGMRERDLARPVVEVFDFESGVCEYEIYKFGEETILCPITQMSRKKAELEDKIKHYFSSFAIIEEDGKLVLKVKGAELRRLKARQIKRLSKLLKRYRCELEQV